ncbi:AraC family transcriptional regulator [Paenibacillus koleovorans]|uniref:AraC family transcriptional regulator n=1 Tax=Paenibacillus koleovorans TaxID=121608 RepID=UPI000FDCA167|nr:AraC family transcriptional regulator [Paenibacillus koleovorans]
MVKFDRLPLHEDLVVKKLVTFHYTELTKDFVYPGEKHNFWEFLYMDKGEAEIVIGARKHHVKQGELVFYSPNEFHSMRANRRVAPNVLILSFECKSEAMSYFRVTKQFRLGDVEQKLLTSILREGYDAFDVGKPHRVPIRNKSPRVFGAEQLIKLNLEMMLILLIRKMMNFEEQRAEDSLSSGNKLKTDAEISTALLALLKETVRDPVKLDDLSRRLNVGKTRLKTVFKRETGFSIVEYRNKLKIEQAKAYIREENMNYTQIAEALGYSSVHYFSRHFKQVTDMSPSQYDKSLRARVLDKTPPPAATIPTGS